MTTSSFSCSVFLCCLLLCLGCASKWELYTESLYHSMQEDSPEARANHARLLEEIISDAESKGKAPYPGLCAEYAFYLASNQRLEEARSYLEKEILYYPEASIFMKIINRMTRGARHVLSEPAEPEKK